MKEMTLKEAKERFGENFWSLTNSVLCRLCGSSTFFRGSESPGLFCCATCGALNLSDKEVNDVKKI